MSGATGTEDLARRGRTELGASKMADEALAGLDEGALRKLVSGPRGRPERQGPEEVTGRGEAEEGSREQGSACSTWLMQRPPWHTPVRARC